MSRLKSYVLVVFCYLLVGLAAAQVVDVSKLSESYRLQGNEMAYIRDTTTSLTIVDIRSNDWQQQFDYLPNVSLGLQEDPYWLRLQFENSEVDKEIVLAFHYPLFDTLELYHYHEGKLVASHHTGDLWPWSTRPVEFVGFGFDLTMEPGMHQVYIRAHSHNSMNLTASVSSPDAFTRERLESDLVHGMYYGWLIVMALYNLFLFFSVRERIYLFMVGLPLANLFLFLSLSGYGTQLFWSESFYMKQNAFVLFAGVVEILSAWFTSAFLNLKKNNRFFYHYMNVLAILGVLFCGLSFVADYEVVIKPLMLFIFHNALIFPFVAALLHFRGEQRALLFLIAWALYLLGTILAISVGVAIELPGWVKNFNILEIGSALETLLFSLALGNKINTLKEEVTVKEKQALKAKIEHQRLSAHNQELDFQLKLREKDLQNEKQQLATTTLWLTQKNSVLQDLQKSLKALEGEADAQHIKALSKKLGNHLHADQDWERFKEHFEKVHTGFFSSLYERFPELTTNEQRLCAYLRMNLSSKEIATLLGVSVNAIEQARRRLRKKLGISNTETNLLMFLQEVGRDQEMEVPNLR
ncbi:7TM diverse intracellular signaling domain-containing protein [Marinoscillum furvescens]|uniref:7TMR-DISM extracellular protein 2 n=1 Tax=Marinoscillum furvescens DSM 4134 TaxID=1122208 RepID=A0A3D9KY82_MARFU|nr:7TM diverse intracellular signaling domain-containing protein [Marinoscillum furvescens]RED94078.1 7TMR-DISM extracellular protein 2 [Marinoscillum furvescens DSM 4134]